MKIERLRAEMAFEKHLKTLFRVESGLVARFAVRCIVGGEEAKLLAALPGEGCSKRVPREI